MDKTMDDVMLSPGIYVVIGRPPQIAAFNYLPQPTGICTAGSQRGNKQLAFSQTNPQVDAAEESEVLFTKWIVLFPSLLVLEQLQQYGSMQCPFYFPQNITHASII